MTDIAERDKGLDSPSRSMLEEDEGNDISEIIKFAEVFVAVMYYSMTA